MHKLYDLKKFNLHELNKEKMKRVKKCTQQSQKLEKTDTKIFFLISNLLFLLLEFLAHKSSST